MSIAFVALLLVACAYPAAAQQGASHCMPPDASAEALLTYARMLAAPADEQLTRTATAYQIPPASAETVTLVADGNLCRRAARSYARELEEGGPLTRRVHIVKIGTMRNAVRYLVADPDHRAGKYEVVMVFDHRFNWLASFTR